MHKMTLSTPPVTTRTFGNSTAEPPSQFGQLFRDQVSTRPILEEINRFLPPGHIQLRGHVRRATTWSSGVCACLCACLLVLPVTLPPVSAHVITRVRRLRMWGGFGSTKNGDAVGDYLSDLWHWSLRTGTWTEHHPKGPMPQLRKWSNFWSTHNGDMVRLNCLSEHT